MGLTKLHVVIYLMVLPLTTQCQSCVCGDTSWWRGQALKLGHSYSNLPYTNTDGAQQFSTGWGYESAAGGGESESESPLEVSTCLVKNGGNDHAECYHTGQLSIMQIPWKTDWLFYSAMIIYVCSCMYWIYICNNLPETVYLHDFHSLANVQLAAEFSPAGVRYVAVFLTLRQSHFDSPQASSPPLSIDPSAVRFHSRSAHALGRVGCCRPRWFRRRQGLCYTNSRFPSRPLLVKLARRHWTGLYI